MKLLVNYCLAANICVSFFYSNTIKAQDTTVSDRERSSSKYYDHYYTGCWRTDHPGDGWLRTRADKTFQWVKPVNNGAATMDTLQGTWRIKSVYSIPFKVTVIVLKGANGRKQQYEIGVTSRPASIFVSQGHEFHKVSCE